MYFFYLDKKTNSWKQKDGKDKDYDFDGKTYFHTNEHGIRHKWDLEENKWVQVENTNETPKEISSDNESEEDDNTTDEQRKARQYR